MVVRIRVLPGMEQRFEAIFAARRKRCLDTEAGTLSYDLFREPAEQRMYAVIESYASPEALQAHIVGSTDHLEMMTCFDGKPVAHRLEACSAAAPQA
jgi:quinol monooxygenase YgiN